MFGARRRFGSWVLGALLPATGGGEVVVVSRLEPLLSVADLPGPGRSPRDGQGSRSPGCTRSAHRCPRHPRRRSSARSQRAGEQVQVKTQRKLLAERDRGAQAEACRRVESGIAAWMGDVIAPPANGAHRNQRAREQCSWLSAGNDAGEQERRSSLPAGVFDERGGVCAPFERERRVIQAGTRE